MASRNANKEVPSKRGLYKYACGTPKEFCSGSNTNCNHGLGNSIRTHGSPEDAFKCHKHYLLKQGYEAVGSRAFASPNNGPVLILTKKSRFGAKLRNGKAATRNMALRHAGIVF